MPKTDVDHLSEPVLRVIEGWVEFADDGVPVDLGVFPANSFIFREIYEVTEAFNDSGTDELELGWTADPDAISGAAVDNPVDSIQIKDKNIVASLGVGAGFNATGRTVQALYTGQNSDASAGKVHVTVFYFVATASP